MAQGDSNILELSPQELLRDYEGVNACGKSSLAGARWAIADIEHACTAPMVRYGKLPFRETVAQYDTHLVWTPMMLWVAVDAFSRLDVSTLTRLPAERPSSVGQPPPVTVSSRHPKRSAACSRSKSDTAPTRSPNGTTRRNRLEECILRPLQSDPEFEVA